jgi:hypothetical protein
VIAWHRRRLPIKHCFGVSSVDQLNIGKRPTRIIESAHRGLSSFSTPRDLRMVKRVKLPAIVPQVR